MRYPLSSGTPRSLRIRLTLLASLMLFIELALIRWLGAQVLYLAYFSNIVLLGSFLGIGLGFLRAGRSERALLPYAPLALAVVLGAAWFLAPSVGLAGDSLIFFGLETSGPPRELVLPVVFVSVAAVMTCIGDGVARTFKQLANLDAYNFDLIGSIVGVASFTVLSFLHAVPLVWGAIAAIGLFLLIAPAGRGRVLLTLVPLVAIVGMLGVESFEANTVWTPYYKTTAEPIGDDNGVIAEVNGIPTWYQYRSIDNPIYETVYQRIAREDPGKVLIIGAGSGNDVAVAVNRGATHIDAVEIDAHLLELGQQHPDRPYDDERVDEHVADGRAYLENSDEKWDLILLALPDSLTLIQGQSSVRLESYLFTEDAVEKYREHLAPGGAFAMYNYYREDWLVDRYAGTLEQEFDTAPCVSVAEGTILSVLVVSEDPSSLRCPPDETFVDGADVPEPVSDDRPFPYLREPTIPSFYLVSIAAMLAISLVAVRAAGGPLRSMRPFTDLFFMGVAFLLLTTKNVVQFALLFGTTWVVNALVFLGVLVSVLLAVLLSKRVRIQRLSLVYAALLASVVVAYLIPGSALLELSTIPRFVAAVALAFTPVFLANVVFAQRFRDTADSTAAFGANLLGAMVGGLLEYTSLILGYRNLLLVVAIVYGLAFLTGRRALTAAA